jgi:hypothetical protein
MVAMEGLRKAVPSPVRERLFTRRFAGGIRLTVNVGTFDGYTTYGGTIRRDTPNYSPSPSLQIMYRPGVGLDSKSNNVTQLHSNVLFADSLIYETELQDSALKSFMLCVRQAVGMLRAENFAGL